MRKENYYFSIMKECKKKLPLDLTFCISLVREISFISEKSCGFEKDENGNHVCAVHYCSQGVNTSVITQFPCGRAYFLYEIILDAPQKI